MSNSKVKYGMMIGITAIIIFLCFSYFREKPHPPANFDALDAKRVANYNSIIFPALQKEVKSGDLVVRLGSDITSEMLRMANAKDQSFSHCGIASKEGDTVFVYHAIGGEFNPDQKLKRETLYSFAHASANKAVAIFDMSLTTMEQKRLEQFYQKAYQDSIPFDMKFDYTTDDRFYCSEFVAKSYSYALNNSDWFQFTRKQNMFYVAVDNLYLSPKAKEKVRFRY